MIGALTLATVIAVAPMSSETSMVGYSQSSYQGKWYHPKWEDERKCIMQRESRFNYRAANSTSSARGAYQFLDSKWRDGLVWMMLDEGAMLKRSNLLETTHSQVESLLSGSCLLHSMETR
jgi:hypothetical protein